MVGCAPELADELLLITVGMSETAIDLADCGFPRGKKARQPAKISLEGRSMGPAREAHLRHDPTVQQENSREQNQH